MRGTHRIRRLRCRALGPPGADGFALRGELRGVLEGSVLPALASAFDSVAPGDEVVEVGRLEVRLSVAAGSDLSAALPGLIAAAVREQLVAVLGAGQGGSPPAKGVRRSSPARSRREALLVYLCRGVLPSAHALLSGDDALLLLRQAVPDLLPDLFVQWSRAGAFPEFLERLLQLVPEVEWPAVGRAFEPGPPVAQPSSLARALERLARRPREASRRARLEAAVKLLMTSMERRPAPGAPPAEESPEGSASGPDDLPRPTSLVIRRRSPSVPPDTGPRVLEPFLPGEESAGDRARDGDSAAGDELPVLAPHAGLVLLHPFLPRLFEATGLTGSPTASLTPGTLHRAASLLYWLATGRDQPVEFELGLIKVLLGLTPASPLVVADGMITAADQQEADALVTAAIGHWAVLRQTSAASFRTGFLQRTGLVYQEDDGWRLRVQPEAFDVLLAHLPWGIGVIRLPWMARPVFCEWPAP